MPSQSPSQAHTVYKIPISLLHFTLHTYEPRALLLLHFGVAPVYRQADLPISTVLLYLDPLLPRQPQLELAQDVVITRTTAVRRDSQSYEKDGSSTSHRYEHLFRSARASQLLTWLPCCRIRLGLRDPRHNEPRKQVEEKGTIRSPGQAGATDRTCRIQRGMFVVPCAKLLGASRRATY